MKLFFSVFLIVFVLVISSITFVSGFETQGVPITPLKIPHSFGLPVHQDITRQGLNFLKPDILTLIVDEHVKIEQDQSSPNHFDNCQFTETTQKINTNYVVAVSMLDPEKSDHVMAAKYFGRIVHPAQDFYSHSNWIEMGRIDLIDPYLGQWQVLRGYTETSHDNPVLVLEEDGKTHSDFSISKVGKDVQVFNKKWGALKLGLISGTFDADVNKCPPQASIPHGGKMKIRFYNDESQDNAEEINKDNPAIQGFNSARVLATEQTTHEFCRLVELVEDRWKQKGVDRLYEIWVNDKNLADTVCDRTKASQTKLTEDSYISVGNQNKLAVNQNKDSTQNKEIKSKDTQKDKNQVEIIAIKIDGKYYPLSQFHEANNQPHLCNAPYFGVDNLYGMLKKIRSIDGVFIALREDGCKFGKVSETKPVLIMVPKEQADAYIKDTGGKPYPIEKQLKKYGLTRDSSSKDTKQNVSKDNTVVKAGNEVIETKTETRPNGWQETITKYKDGTKIAEGHVHTTTWISTTYTNGTTIEVFDGGKLIVKSSIKDSTRIHYYENGTRITTDGSTESYSYPDGSRFVIYNIYGGGRTDFTFPDGTYKSHYLGSGIERITIAKNILKLFWGDNVPIIQSQQNGNSGDNSVQKSTITPNKESLPKSTIPQTSLTKDQIKSLYLISKWQEATAVSLSNLNDQEESILKQFKITEKSKKTINSIELLIKKQSIDKKKIKQIQDATKKVSIEIQKMAKNQGILFSDLEKIAKTPQQKISKPQPITRVSQLKQGVDAAKISLDEAGKLIGDEKIDSAGFTPSDNVFEKMKVVVTPEGTVIIRPMTEEEILEKSKQNVISMLQQLIDLSLKEEQSQVRSILDTIPDPIKEQTISDPTTKPIIKPDQSKPITPNTNSGSKIQLQSKHSSYTPPDNPCIHNQSVILATWVLSKSSTIAVGNARVFLSDLDDENASVWNYYEIRVVGGVVQYTFRGVQPGHYQIGLSSIDNRVVENSVMNITIPDMCTSVSPPPILVEPSQETKLPPTQTNTKPTLAIPKQITQEATSSSGATVNYNVSGQDKEDGALTPSCSYPSGYVFPIGITTISCTVDDSNNNSISGTFTVTIRDTTPPNIAAFKPTEGTRDETGIQVFFEVTAYDLVDGNIPVTCNYQSGYKFPIGITTLSCTADDSRGNHASRSLQITVTAK